MASGYKTIAELRFDIDVVVRYHDRRRAFFDTFRRLIAGLTVFGGSAAAVAFWGYLESSVPLDPRIGLVGALLVAALNAYDLVTGISAKARQHDSLYRRYVELDEQIVRADENKGQLRQWEAELLRIERDEPPMFRAVYTMCQNEAVKVWRLENSSKHKVNWVQSLFAHFLRMPRAEFPAIKHG